MGRFRQQMPISSHPLLILSLAFFYADVEHLEAATFAAVFVITCVRLMFCSIGFDSRVREVVLPLPLLKLQYSR